MAELADLPISLLIAAALAVGVMTIALFARLRAALWVIGAMFFIASVGVTSATHGGSPMKLWIWPITFNRSPIFAICGGLLLVSMIAHSHDVMRGRRPAQGLMLLAIGLYAGLLRVAHEGPTEGLVSMLFALITIGPLLYVVPALLKEWDDFPKLIRVLAWTNVVWIFCVGVQFVVNADLLTKGAEGRLFGLTGQTQHCAAYVAIMATITLWLFLNDSKRALRWLWLVLFGLNVVMAMWTGSRTGAGMLIIGVTAILFSRVGRSVLLLPVAALAVWGAVQVAMAIGIDLSMAERLTSTADTRSRAWFTLIEVGSENPLFGAGIEGAEDSENSYLQAFAAYGLGMVMLVIGLVVVTGFVVLNLLRLRRWAVPVEKALIDLVIGYNAMYFGAAVLEGIIMARVGVPLMMMLIATAIASQLRPYFVEQVESAEDEEREDYEAYEEDSDPYGYPGYGEYPEAT